MNNLFSAELKKKTHADQASRQKIEFSAFVIVFVVFVAIAVMQSFELGDMLAEAKSIGNDIGAISAKQDLLLEQYFLK